MPFAGAVPRCLCR